MGRPEVVVIHPDQFTRLARAAERCADALERISRTFEKEGGQDGSAGQEQVDPRNAPDWH